MEQHQLTPGSPTGFARLPSGEEALVVAEELTKVVGSGRAYVCIIDNASFTVPARSLFAINGPSGSGKTTLLNLLAGIDRPTRGRISVQGQSLIGESENALARWRAQNVGIIFQFFHLIPTLTASENVLLALELGRRCPRKSWRDRTAACLAAVGMESYARRLPSELSGGEQQRIAIARALANDPPLIVADEPTGNLDSKNAATVFSHLEQLTEHGKTVIYVTHDPQLASRASASVDLLDGRIVARRDTPSAAEEPCVSPGR